MPHFSADALSRSLPEREIAYEHLGALGGFPIRSNRPSSVWDFASGVNPSGGGNNPSGGGVRKLAKSTPIEKEREKMIGVLIAVLFAALVYAICVAFGLSAIVGIVAAILVLLAGVPSGGYGLGSRFGGRY